MTKINIIYMYLVMFYLILLKCKNVYTYLIHIAPQSAVIHIN